MRVPKTLMAAAAAGIVMLAPCGTALAQPGNTPPNVAAFRHPLLGRLAAVLGRLDLTPAQRQQVRGFLEAAKPQVQALKTDTTLTPPQKREKLREIVTALRKDIVSILTPVQRQKLRRMMAAPGPIAGGLARRWALILGKLDLSPAQKTRVRGFVKNAVTRAQAVRRSRLAPAAQRARIAAIQKDLRQNIVGILTPAQRAKLQALLRKAASGPKGAAPSPAAVRRAK